jgi:hypothetical protein
MNFGPPPTLTPASLSKKCLITESWTALDRWVRHEYWATQSWAKGRIVDVRVVDNGGVVVGPKTRTSQVTFSDLVGEFLGRLNAKLGRETEPNTTGKRTKRDSEVASPTVGYIMYFHVTS